MKRITNDVAVQTLLYTVPSNIEVRIVDIDHHLVPSTERWEELENPGGEIFTVDDILHNWENIKIAKAKIRRTAVNNNHLLLVIDTKVEEY